MRAHKPIKINENTMPKLYGNPTPDVIRKFLVKSKHHFASKIDGAWERVQQRNRLDINGELILNNEGQPIRDEVLTVESMLLIFPEGSTAGRYPIPIEPEEPAAVTGESSFEKEKKIIKWKNEMQIYELQKNKIINAKLSYSGEFKQALSTEVQDVMRRQEIGREALDGNDPLEIINVLLSTDFSPKATVAASPMVKYEEAIERFNGEILRQEYNESLDSWEKRFGAERVNLTNIAVSAGKQGELPSEESMAYKFFMRTNGIYNKVREDVRTGARPGGFPHTVLAAMEILRPYEKPNQSNKNKGVYIVKSGNVGNKSDQVSKGWSHKCPLHKSNDHNYNDKTCNEILQNSGRKSEENQGSKVKNAVNQNQKNRKGN